MKKRAVNLILALALLLSLSPRAAADEPELEDIWDGSTAAGFASGAGTETDPYVIVNGAQLSLLAAIVNASGTVYKGFPVAACRTAWYRLDEDICLNDTTCWKSWAAGTAAPANGWTPIGIEGNVFAETVFNGKFEGNGHSISGLYVSIEGNCAGLFGNIGPSAAISDLSLVESYVAGQNYVGGIAGNSDRGSIRNCENAGDVKGQNHVGGIVGYDVGGDVTDCRNTGEVAGNSYIGGIAGENVDSAISGCYNKGGVKAETAAGGITGFNHDAVVNCFNIGDVGAKNNAGGIAGGNNQSITRCYSTGAVSGLTRGGIVGIQSGGTIGDCYYLEASVADPTDANGTALSPPQMRTGASFAGFDFDSVWTMEGNASYPYPELINNGLNGSFVSEINITGGDTVLAGSAIELGAAVSPEGADVAIVWSVTNDTGEAEIGQNGRLTALSKGRVTVRATAADGAKACAEKTVYVAEIWDGTNAAAFDSGSGTAEDPYVIMNGEELSLLAKILDSSGGVYDTGSALYLTEDVRTAHFRLGADIYLNGTSGWQNWGRADAKGGVIEPQNLWTAIGRAELPFNGSFDGGGHAVSGLYLRAESCAGLFENIGAAAEVKRVCVVSSYLSGGDCTGAIAGRCAGGRIEVCYSRAAVDGRGLYTGGIIGYCEGASIKNCFNLGKVKSYGGYAGGIAGKCAGGKIENCYNTGVIAGEGHIGGVTGETDGATVEGCFYFSSCAAELNDTGGAPLGTAALGNPASFTGFDFDSVWTMEGNGSYGYPELRAVALTGKFASNLSLTGSGTLTVGQKTRISAEVSPADAEDTSVVWRVSDGTGRAEIDENGWVSGLSQGTVKVFAVTCDGSGIVAEKTFTVIPVYVSQVTVTCGYDSVFENASVQMSAAVLPENAQDKSVHWSVINGTGQAAITENGLLTGISAGTVTVRAAAADGSGVYGDCQMTVLPAAITSGVFKVSDGKLSKIAPGTRVSGLKANLSPRNKIKILDRYGNEVPDSAAVGTGMLAVLASGGNTVQTLTIVVTGDVNGDGSVSISDMLAVKAHILGKSKLSGVWAEAADASGDGGISITDFIQSKAHILGKSAITPR